MMNSQLNGIIGVMRELQLVKAVLRNQDVLDSFLMFVVQYAGSTVIRDRWPHLATLIIVCNLIFLGIDMVFAYQKAKRRMLAGKTI